MYFRGIDLPAALIEAHGVGRLAIFVGAGASMGPPSALPGFKDLVKKIRDGSNLTSVFPDKDLNKLPLDEILGKIKFDYGVDVHRRIFDVISQQTSRPAWSQSLNDEDDGAIAVGVSPQPPRNNRRPSPRYSNGIGGYSGITDMQPRPPLRAHNSSRCATRSSRSRSAAGGVRRKGCRHWAPGLRLAQPGPRPPSRLYLLPITTAYTPWWLR
jgi:hypothetical protein